MTTFNFVKDGFIEKMQGRDMTFQLYLKLRPLINSIRNRIKQLEQDVQYKDLKREQKQLYKDYERMYLWNDDKIFSRPARNLHKHIEMYRKEIKKRGKAVDKANKPTKVQLLKAYYNVNKLDWQLKHYFDELIREIFISYSLWEDEYQKKIAKEAKKK